MVYGRDFVTKRFWKKEGDEYFLLMHSIDYDEIPEKKEFVRGHVYITGYLFQPHNNGCHVWCFIL